LEDAGLLTRTVYPEVPPRVEYALTDLGVSVSDPLARLRQWVEDHVDQTSMASLQGS
jgi:DNA-binding HxlR family transcriptional regulator